MTEDTEAEGRFIKHNIGRRERKGGEDGWRREKERQSEGTECVWGGGGGTLKRR